MLEHLCRKHPEGKPWKRFMIQSPKGKQKLAQWAWQDDAGVWNPYSDENITKVLVAAAAMSCHAMQCNAALILTPLRAGQAANAALILSAAPHCCCYYCAPS